MLMDATAPVFSRLEFHERKKLDFQKIKFLFYY